MVKKIVKSNQSSLHLISKEIDFEKVNVRKLFQDMKDTCEARNGVGIAAPQIGINLRAFLFRPLRGAPIFMINPIVLNFSDDFISEEGCLSAQGKFGKVKRAKKIEIQWKDMNKNSQQMTFYDEFAAIIQHEIDHLEGILCIDKFEKK